MKIGIRKSGMVVVFLTAILLSACAEGMPNDVLTGTISKPGGEVALLGTLEGISESVWTVDGRTIKLSDDTKLQSDLRIGDSVRVDVALGDDGFMNALAIEASSLDMFIVGAEIEFYGVVEEITSVVWLIAGFEVGVPPETEIKAGIMVGDLVKVHASFGEEGALIASEIELAEEDDEQGELDRFEIEFFGVVEVIADEVWIIESFELIITPRTEIAGFIQVGDLVKVHATFSDGDVLVAREVELAGEDDHARDEIEFAGIVEAVSDASWTIDGREVVVTPQTEIKDQIQDGDLVKVHAFLGEGDVLIAREIELAGTDDEIDDHDRDEIKFVGTVEAISNGEWLIDGRIVLVTHDTEIEDQIEVGDVVKVEAFENADGSLVAHEIELADDDSDLDRDSNDDMDDSDSNDDDMDDEEGDHDEDEHDDYDDGVDDNDGHDSEHD